MLTQALFGLGATAVVYWASVLLHRRWPTPLLSPALVTSVVLGSILACWGGDFDSYRRGAEPLVTLLGPASAAMAVPLFRHRRLVLRGLRASLVGLSCGAIANVCAALTIAAAFQASPALLRALSLKSVTTSVATELAAILGANAGITVSIVVATGLLGATFGPWLLDRFQIANPLARGFALGGIAQGLGTARAAREGDVQGAAASAAMGIAALVASLSTPLLLPALLAVLS
jgi:putative effector of murein hydrolase